jgi:hypothetical protein
MSSKVLIMDSTYETCAAAVEKAFDAFPMEIAGKKVVVKVMPCGPATPIPKPS